MATLPLARARLFGVVLATSVLAFTIAVLSPAAAGAASPATVGTAQSSTGAERNAAASATQRQSAARLRLTVRGLPRAIPVNQARRFQLRITNTGKAAARRIQLSLNGTRGLTLRPAKRSFNLLRAGATVGLNVVVRANRRAAARGRIAVTAKAPRVGTARVARPITVQRGGAGQNRGGGAVTSPAGHYFWALEPIRVDRSSNATGFYFVNDRFVHVGLPEGGLPNCNRANAKRDSEGKIESGCVRYTFNQRNGVVVIAGEMRGRFTAKRGNSSIEIDDKSYYLATVPKAGTRLQTTLIHRGHRGFCGLITGCTTWKENLGLDRQGRFVRSRSSITTLGGSGAPFVWGASFPPDEYGTYRILGNGRIQFRYMDGSVVNETIAIQHNDQGRTDAANEGLILDNIWFYQDDDE